MAVESGQIARGTVVHLMPYGALVRLEDGTTGLVHISEIDQNFVHNVTDHIQKGDTVIVKVLASGEKGKTELSIKQAKGEEAPPPAPEAEGGSETENRETENRGYGNRDENRGSGNRDENRDYGRRDENRDEEQGEEGQAAPAPYPRREGRAAFEDKMRDFLNNSSERLGDVRRNSDSKLGRKPR